MSQYQGNPSGRRSGRGGRNRRSGRDSGPRQDYRPNTPPAAPPEPEKQSLLQKLLGFFRPKKSAATANGDTRSASRSTVTSSYPAAASPGQREPRERENREGREGRENRENREPSAPRTVRKPEAVEVTTPRLYVGNLSFEATESDLFELFAGVGSVKAAEVVTHKETERSKGFAFVTMGSIDEAKRAVAELHDKEFMTRKLVVSGAKTPVDRG